MKSFLFRIKIYLVLAIVLLAFIGFNAYMAREAIIAKTANLNSIVEFNEKDPLNAINPFKNTKEYELVKQKALLEAQLELSNSDSIALIIDLVDSLAFLQIKGVTIYQAKITKYFYSSALKSMSMPAYYKLFSNPLTVYEQKSTVVKEPIVVKIAPKDTIEAAKAEVIPDSVVNQSAVLEFKINQDILVVISNHEEDEGSYLKHKFFWSYQFLEQLMKNKKVAYQPTIKIIIPNTDIVVIYRALPWKSRIAIRL
jgi:hypothetical protein